jgi:hypothetical protein
MKAARTIHKNTAQNGKPAVWVGRRPRDAISRGVHFDYRTLLLPVKSAALPQRTVELEAQIRESLKRVTYGE